MQDARTIDLDGGTPELTEGVMDDDAGLEPSKGADLMSVLTPATPPVPRNARLICRGIGMGGRDATQRDSAAVSRDTSGSAKREQRRAARALRNTSLRGAAGLD